MRKFVKRISIMLNICIAIILIPNISLQTAEATESLTFTDYEPEIIERVNAESGFKHPGIAVTEDELSNARTQIKNGVDPWNSYLEGMLSSQYASKNYKIRNQDSLDSSKAKYSYKDYTSAFMENTIKQDAMAAYAQAILYYFTGDEDYRQKSLTILRLWSQLDPSEAGDVADGKIKMSYPMYYMVSAAEFLKCTSCKNENLKWTDEDENNFIINFIKPPMKYYLAPASAINYWMNQYNYALLARIAADIYTNDIEDYKTAVEMATVNKSASDQGSHGALARIMRKVNEDGLTEGVDDSIIQVAEMGRDQAHAAGNITCLTTIAYMFEAQGTKVDPVSGEYSTNSDAVNMFNFLDNRLLRGANYFFKYNLGYETEWQSVATSASMKDGYITNVKSTYDTIYDQCRGRFYNADSLYYYYKSNTDTAYLLKDEKVGKYLAEEYSKSPSPKSGGYFVGDGLMDVWLHIPASEADTGGTFKNETTKTYEVENKYTLLGGTAVKERDADTSYLKLDADEEGTKIALLAFPNQRDRSGYSTINFRVKTNSNSVLELRRDSELEPFKTINLPNTNGEWTEISIDMNVNEVSYSAFLQDMQILFLNVTGKNGDYVALDSLKISPTDNYSPQFENSISEKTVITYAGSSMIADFAATDKNNDEVKYSIINSPTEAGFNEKTGEFSWTPKKIGDYVFFIQATDGKSTSVLKVTVKVLSDINEVIERIIKPYDSKESYESMTKKKYIQAYENIKNLVDNNETDEVIINETLNKLQEAVNGLKLLTPLLSDGTMDYTNMVMSSLADSKEKNLVDGDTETFTGDLRNPNSYFTFDFGKDYAITADAFKMQSRKYFSGRIWKSIIYGSNDGENWTQLTNVEVGDTDKMVEMPVIEEYRNTKFRYLKVASGANVFNAAEFRIVGRRYENINYLIR